MPRPKKKEKKLKIISERIKTEFREIQASKPEFVSEEKEESLEEEIQESENLSNFSSESAIPILQSAQTREEPIERALENVPAATSGNENIYEPKYSMYEDYSIREQVKPASLFMEEHQEITPRRQQTAWGMRSSQEEIVERRGWEREADWERGINENPERKYETAEKTQDKRMITETKRRRVD